MLSSANAKSQAVGALEVLMVQLQLSLLLAAFNASASVRKLLLKIGAAT